MRSRKQLDERLIENVKHEIEELEGYIDRYLDDYYLGSGTSVLIPIRREVSSLVLNQLVKKYDSEWNVLISYEGPNEIYLHFS